MRADQAGAAQQDEGADDAHVLPALPREVAHQPEDDLPQDAVVDKVVKQGDDRARKAS